MTTQGHLSALFITTSLLLASGFTPFHSSLERCFLMVFNTSDSIWLKKNCQIRRNFRWFPCRFGSNGWYIIKIGSKFIPKMLFIYHATTKFFTIPVYLYLVVYLKIMIAVVVRDCPSTSWCSIFGKKCHNVAHYQKLLVGFIKSY